METIFIILTVQVVLGAFDNLWHHELTEKLPSRISQRGELALHTVREALYAVTFIGLAWYEWHGLFAWALAAILATEVAVTIWDFLIEDRTRKLSPFERVLHTVLAINAGVFLALLAPVLLEWAARPTDLVGVDHGWWSWAFTAFAAGVGIWAVRDLVAVMRLTIERIPEWLRDPILRGEKPAPRTWLIAGGTGFIGRRLVRALIGEGDHVIVWARDGAKAAHMYGPHVEVVTDLNQIHGADRIDTIVNLAGEPILGGLWTARRREKLLDSRIRVTSGIIRLIRRLERRPGVLVSGSAIGFYGEAGEEELTEYAGAGDGFAAELCRQWEAEARQAEEYGVRVVRLRMGLVIDPEGGVLKALRDSARLGGGVIMGDGRQWQSWISLDDLIGLILFAEDRPRMSGAVNAVAPWPLRQEEMARLIARSVRRPAWLKVPARLLRLLPGGMAAMFLTSQKIVPAQAKAAGYQFRDHAFGDVLTRFAERERTAPEGPALALFNMDCPVCGTEARMCQRQIDTNGGDPELGIVHLADRPDLLDAFGLKPEHLSRRLYILEDDGRMHAGIDAMIRIWRRIPVYRWRARVAALPGIHLAASFLYETVVAPYIDGRYGVNSRRARRLRSGMHPAE